MASNSSRDARGLTRRPTCDGTGKIPRDFMEEAVWSHLGANSEDVLVGPGAGLDNAVVSLAEDKVMVVSTDPLSMIPSIGMKDSAWLSVHEIASDVMTSAIEPRFAIVDFNLPPSLSLDDLRTYVRAFSDECNRLEIAIIGGHTGKYPGCDFTVVGAGVMMATGGRRDYVVPAMMMPRDKVLMTKSAAIEATAILAKTFPGKSEKTLGGKVVRRVAREYLRSCSTYLDASIASSVGIRKAGVTGMHDATEGGILGALSELASAAGKTIVVERDRINVSQETAALCQEFGLDPLTTLSEGSLLITCRPGRVEEVVSRLKGGGIESHAIGEVRDALSKSRRSGGRLLVSAPATGGSKDYVPPAYDGYWDVYSRGLKEAWE